MPKPDKQSSSQTTKRNSSDGPAVPKNKLAALSDFKRDETLMFQPVAAERGALEVVYAYPNEYTGAVQTSPMLHPTPLLHSILLCCSGVPC